MSTRGDRRSRYSSDPTVLIVDDEETPRTTTCRMVRALGYQARVARDGREALRYIQQHPGEIRLILTDVIMPYMDGGELAERARDLHPRLPIVLMSAYPMGEIAELIAAYPELPFLEKPDLPAFSCALRRKAGRNSPQRARHLSAGATAALGRTHSGRGVQFSERALLQRKAGLCRPVRPPAGRPVRCAGDHH
jgi:CheY-like chemotaxis protein